VVHCAEKQNSLSLFSDIADHGHAAIEPKFSAVDLPQLGSLHHWRDVWFVLSQRSHNSPTLLQEMHVLHLILVICYPY